MNQFGSIALKENGIIRKRKPKRFDGNVTTKQLATYTKLCQIGAGEYLASKPMLNLPFIQQMQLKYLCLKKRGHFLVLVASILKLNSTFEQRLYIKTTTFLGYHKQHPHQQQYSNISPACMRRSSVNFVLSGWSAISFFTSADVVLE